MAAIHFNGFRMILLFPLYHKRIIPHFSPNINRPKAEIFPAFGLLPSIIFASTPLPADAGKYHRILDFIILREQQNLGNDLGGLGIVIHKGQEHLPSVL